MSCTSSGGGSGSDLESIFREILSHPILFDPDSILTVLGKLSAALPQCMAATPDPDPDKEPFLPWLQRRIFYWWAKNILANDDKSLLVAQECLQVERAILAATQRWRTDQFRDTIKGILGVFQAVESIQCDHGTDHILRPFPLKEPNATEAQLVVPFETFQQLEALQTGIHRLFSEFAKGIFLYCLPQQKQLWQYLLIVLEEGGLELKLAAVDLAASLVKAGAKPGTLRLSLRLYDCLFSTINALYAMKEVGEQETFLANGVCLCLQELLGMFHEEGTSLVEKRLFCGEVISCIKDLAEINREHAVPSVQLHTTILNSLHLAIDLNVLGSLDLSIVIDLKSKEEAIGCLAALVFSESKDQVAKSCSELAIKTAEGAIKKNRRVSAPASTSSLPQMQDASPAWKRICDDLVEQLTHRTISITTLKCITEIARAVLVRLSDHAAPAPVHVCFLPRDVLLECLQVFIQQIVHSPAEADTFGSFCQITKNVLFFQPTETLTQNLLTQTVALATMPWMGGEVKLADLRVTSDSNMVKSSQQLYEAAMEDMDVVKEALELMSLPGKEVASKWRIKVLEKILLEGNPALIKLIVEQMPMWMQSLGHGSHPLAKRVISACLQSDNKMLVQALSKKSGIIVCLFSKLTSLQRDGNGFQVVCSRCSKKKMLKGANDPILDSDEVADLFKLIGHNDAEVKEIILCMVEPMSNHIGFQRTIMLWLKYVEEMEEAPTVQFAAVVENLLAPPAADPSLTSVTHLPGWERQKEVCERLMDCLEEMAVRATRSWHVVFVDTLIRVLVKTGSCGVEWLEERSAFLLLDLLFSKCCHVTAFYHAEEMLRVNLTKYKSRTMEKLAKRIIETKDKEPIECLKIVFNSKNMKRFLQQHVKYLLPHVVLLSSQRASNEALKMISVLMGEKLRKLLADNIMYIYPHLVINSPNNNVYTAATHFLEKETAIKLTQLLPSHRQKVMTELLLSFHTNQKRVITAFQWLAKEDEQQKEKGKTVNTKAELVAYILPKFLGVLGFFDDRLRKRIPDRSKIEVLKALLAIFKFMASHGLSSVKHKILGTLRAAAAAKIPNTLPLLGELWMQFVTNVDVPSLESLLTQIVASLWPLYEQGVPQSLELYRYLVIKNRDALKPHLAQLNFLPDEPELTEINESIRRASGLASTSTFKDVLAVIIPSLSTESVDVKALALRKLKQLLRMNQRSLHILIVSSDLVDPMVGKLIERLMACTKDNDHAVVTSAGRCLGFIGAVDPGRLKRHEDLSVTFDNDIAFSLFEADFVHDLLKTLSNAFLMTTEAADANECEYSLQEVLRAYKIKGADKIHTLPGQVWNKLSDTDRELLTPFISSCYSRADDDSSFSLPIFKADRSYSEWLSSWCFHLISKVKEEQARSVLDGCKAALKKDVKTAQFLLPHIILTVLCQENPKDREEIENEIHTVVATGKKETEELHRLASQTIFAILDHMSRWLRKKYKKFVQTCANNKRNGDRGANTDPEKVKNKDRSYGIIDSFVNSIPQNILATASYQCGAYARSLMHWEIYLRKHPEELQPCIGTLQHVYGALNEQDYVVGAAAVRKAETPLKDLVHLHECMGNFNDALACYETMGKSSNAGNWQTDMVRCYLAIDQPHTASLMVQGITETNPELQPEMRKYQLEAAWQLGQWETIDAVPVKQTTPCWEIGLSRLLKCIHTEDRKSFMRQLEVTTQSLMSPISAAAMEEGAFERSYGHLVKLQILNEVEMFAESAIFGKASIDMSEGSLKSLSDLLDSWSTRTSYAQYSAAHLETVLKVRRTVLDVALKRGPGDGLEAVLKRSLSDVWLLSSKVARKSGQLQKAYNVLLDCDKFDLKKLFVEKAKLCWARKETKEAIDVLKKGIPEYFPWYNAAVAKKGRAVAPNKQEIQMLFSAKLQLARYIDESSNQEADSVPTFYNDARAVSNNSEDAYYYLAKFYEKFIGKDYKSEDLDGRGEVVTAIINQYVRSLMLGCQHILHSLPRMLSLWFDYGSRVALMHGEAKADKKKVALYNDMAKSLKKMNEVVTKFMTACPPYYFLLVFPQLTSRICHSHEDVWHLLKKMLVTCFVRFPEHCFWHMVALSKSSYNIRVKRCQEVFDLAQQTKPSIKKMLVGGVALADQLQALSEEKLNLSAKKLSEAAPNLYKCRNNYSSILIPSTRNMSLVLPSKEGDLKSHDPFQDQAVFLGGIVDELTVMRSMVCPKKVTFRGSDGKKYSFLCKPKDDLRRDCRLIDFNNLLNKLFMKDPECRKRDLKIRTYKVVPLNESSGLIEWIENLTPLRAILVKLYKEIGVQALGERDLHQYATLEDDIEGNRKKYDTLIARHPPVFPEWFLRNFPDPQTWFMARLSYVRTTAVMSMVGYLHGLGDRHAENILFDSTNGETVHVDLNCLFNKGDDLKIPEVVPFRLTQNMVSAMGPTGAEGPFVKACEAALGLMRRQKEVLMTALRPFYFDPLVDWVAGGKQRQKQGERSEVVNAKAVETLNQIDQRLDGLVASATAKRRAAGSSSSKNKLDMPLSVVGQVNFLIKEATEVENLSQMYHGWTNYY